MATQCSVQFSSVPQSCPTHCDPMNRSMPGLPGHHQLPEFTQTHVHQVGDAIQPSHPRLSPSPPASNPSQNQGLFQWVNTSHEVAKVLEFQPQHQSFQWTRRTDLLYFFKFIFIYLFWRLLTLQYCIGFAIHQHEFTTGIHVLVHIHNGVLPSH